MASPRDRAASMETARFSFTFFCPMNSAKRWGRSFNSNVESSSTGAAETRRSRLYSRLFLAVATASDGRTKYESAQCASCSTQRSWRILRHFPQRPAGLHRLLTVLLLRRNRASIRLILITRLDFGVSAGPKRTQAPPLTSGTQFRFALSLLAALTGTVQAQQGEVPALDCYNEVSGPPCEVNLDGNKSYAPASGTLGISIADQLAA